MVGNHADGDVRFLVFGGGLVRHLGGRGAVVLHAYFPGNELDERLENVGVVVRLHARHGHHQALEAHAGVHALLGQLDERLVGQTLELHEYVVPDFHHLRVVGVHEVAAGGGGALFIGAQVDVDFGARAAGAGVAHLPEIVLLVAGQNAVVGSVGAPEVLGFGVGAGAVGHITLEIRHVEAVFLQLVHLRQQLPGPGNGVGFEVVAERPVAQHLEHGVVVGVVADFLQIVVLAAHAQALLGIGNALVGRGLIAQKVVLERSHARVDKQQRGVVLHHNRGRGHDVMAFAGEKIEKLLANSGSGGK